MADNFAKLPQLKPRRSGHLTLPRKRTPSSLMPDWSFPELHSDLGSSGQASLCPAVMASNTREVERRWRQQGSGLLLLRQPLSWNLYSLGRIMVLDGSVPTASNRAHPGRSELLLPPLRSPLFRDAFAIFQEAQQICQMCSLRTNHRQVGFNRSSYLQAHPST
jgi:hypothetical protein